MTPFNRVLIWFCCVALLMPALTSSWAQDGDVSDHPLIGDKAPPFELRTISGDTLSLDDWKGKFVVLHFGASW